MFRSRFCRFVAVSLCLLPGCGGGDIPAPTAQLPLPPVHIAPVSTDHLPVVDHPEYANWSRFAVGTTVMRKKEVTNDFGTVRVATQLKLVEKTPTKVVVESQVTMERGGEPPVANQPQQFEYNATFRLPAGMHVEQFSLPSLKANQAEDETRQACGQAFQAQVFTWDERNETGPMRVKYWRCDEIPGRMLRQEINGHMHQSLEEVVEIKKPAEQVGQDN